MTPKAQTMRAALELYATPTRVRLFRQQPLPEDTHFLLQVATGDEPALGEAQVLSGREPEVLQQAAAFFVEQVLLETGSDSYRTLGAQPTDPIAKIRHHMALLMRWLHPDCDPEGQRALLAPRVIRAWDDLKSPERRRSYDAKSHRDEASSSSRSQPRTTSEQRTTSQQRSTLEPRSPASKSASRGRMRGPSPESLGPRSLTPGFLFDRRRRWGVSSFLPRPIFVALCRMLYR